MAKITEYQTSKGTFYRFRLYAGIDDQTGKKKYVKRAGFKTKAAAKKELIKLEYELDTGNYFKPVERMTFKDVYDLWIVQHELTIRESTLNTLKSKFRSKILPAFGDYQIEKITLGMCQKIVNQWSKEVPGIYPALCHNTSRIFEYARRLKYIKENPFRDVIRPRRQSKQKERNYLELDELKKFLDTAKDDDLKAYAIFRTLAYSGMRCGELLALTWSDIDFKNNTISIDKTQARGERSALIVQRTKTATSQRVLDMDIETMQILKQWKVKQASYWLKRGQNVLADSQWVFSNVNNEFMSPAYIRRHLVLICEQAGLPVITIHGFRHTHATLLLSAGASVKEVQTRLGHSKVQTTLDIYTHLTKQDQKETIQKLVNFMR
ncbi:site-specific integrase [Ligilactobacillus apodemi]|nr:site-specific integrase [Ligilactobacillus apodemi]